MSGVEWVPKGSARSAGPVEEVAFDRPAGKVFRLLPADDYFPDASGSDGRPLDWYPAPAAV